MTDSADELRDTLRAALAEIPPEQAENDGWPQLAMPAMLAELGITKAPELTWFAAAVSPLYDTAPADGWRYCHTTTDPDKPDLLGMALAGPPRRIYIRADVSLPLTIQTLGHELWHVREFDRGDDSLVSIMSKSHLSDNVSKAEPQRLGVDDNRQQEPVLICSDKFVQDPEAVSPTFGTV